MAYGRDATDVAFVDELSASAASPSSRWITDEEV